MIRIAERVIEAAKDFSEAKRGDERQQLPGFWRASSMGMCARQQAYDFKGLRSEWERTGEKHMGLEDGHVHEADVIARILALPGVEEVAQNRRVRKMFKSAQGTVVKIAGTPDLEIKDNGEYVVVEVKALQDNTFQEVKRAGEPPEKYKAQLLTYLLLLKCQAGVLYIKNRNTSEVLDFEIFMTDERKRALLKRQLWIQKLVDEKKLPPREYQLGSPECFWCPHNKRCWPSNNFKGYIHKKGAEKGIMVDLEDEKPKHKFLVAARTFEEAKRKIAVLESVQNEAKAQLEHIMKKYKADGISASGYSAKWIFSETSHPDSKVIKNLIASGAIPVVQGSSSYIRVDLPKGKKAKE